MAVGVVARLLCDRDGLIKSGIDLLVELHWSDNLATWTCYGTWGVDKEC